MNREPSFGSARIADTLREGIIIGLRQSVPTAVGIVVRGLAVLALAALAHLVLGLSIPMSTLAGAAGAGVVGADQVLARRRERLRARSEERTPLDGPARASLTERGPPATSGRLLDAEMISRLRSAPAHTRAASTTPPD